MKRVGNIYENVYNIENIITIYKKIRKTIKNKKKLEVFDDYYTSNIIYIKNILENREYEPLKYNIFVISEPKHRIIMSQSMIDKIINHLCCEYLLKPYLEKSLIDNNVATRKNKGTSYGLKKLKSYLNCMKNENYYYLKFDISKYFYNIDHDILKKMLLKKIKDKDALNILFKIIDSTDLDYINNSINRLKEKNNNLIGVPNYKKGKGLPIGNMTSQFLAIYYLNDLDHYIKEKLKIKHYIRYMDDGILFSKDKNYLKECLNNIIIFLKNYGLVLNNKTIISNINNNINFLSFNFKVNHNLIIIRVNNKIKRNFINKLKTKNLKSIVSYKGHLAFCTNNIYYKYMKEQEEIKK